MKEGLHPRYEPVIFVDTSTGKEFVTRSTVNAKESRDVDGVKHKVIGLEVTSDTHPFWTGKMHRLDTAGRIERFEKKFSAPGSIATGKKKTRKEVVRKREE